MAKIDKFSTHAQAKTVTRTLILYLDVYCHLSKIQVFSIFGNNARKLQF